ncbi:VWA domain-containing protein [Rhodosalinus sp. K401]|uniref:vWA domain-containing protein n=1 Tax=Rhodosalinus sp. K401 TaxID=3239195 RepID=UPI0035261939
MPEHAPLELPEHPRLVANLVHFARALRKAGLRVGTGRVADATRAVEAAGFTDRRDFYHVLEACFVSRPEERRVFAQVFRLFWRDPRFMEHMMAMMLPALRGVAEERQAEAAEKRAAEALLHGAEPPATPQREEKEEGETEIEIDASLTMSAEERLRTLDFEQMSADEIARARRILAGLTLPVRPIPSRRAVGAPSGRAIDRRRTLRAAIRTGGEMQRLHHARPRPRWPNLVALCDISGSMSQYSRVILHFLHAVSNRKGAGWSEVHAFTFGTRLTNITRHLRARDVDAALAAAGAEAQDWEGGTRIGDCLHAFNRDWSRRVMGQGAVVLLITDGLERGDPERLEREMERLRLTARRLVWVNPLLRFGEFAPKAQGIRAMLPHVDSMRAGHSIATLEELAAALCAPEDAGERARLMSALVPGAA